MGASWGTGPYSSPSFNDAAASGFKPFDNYWGPAPAMAAIDNGQPSATSTACMAPCARGRKLDVAALHQPLRATAALCKSLAAKAACMRGWVRPADQLVSLAHDQPPLDNPLVRRALAPQAVNRRFDSAERADQPRGACKAPLRGS